MDNVIIDEIKKGRWNDKEDQWFKKTTNLSIVTKSNVEWNHTNGEPFFTKNNDV